MLVIFKLNMLCKWAKWSPSTTSWKCFVSTATVWSIDQSMTIYRNGLQQTTTDYNPNLNPNPLRSVRCGIHSYRIDRASSAKMNSRCRTVAGAQTNGGVECRVDMKKSRFSINMLLYLGNDKVLWNENSNSYAIYRIVLLPITSSDTEWFSEISNDVKHLCDSWASRFIKLQVSYVFLFIVYQNYLLQTIAFTLQYFWYQEQSHRSFCICKMKLNPTWNSVERQ